MHISILDGYRGFAIILVILYHFYPNLFRNGFLGVDIFFILSGFLIHFSQRNKSNNSVLLFLSIRIKKIYPLKTCVIYIITILNYIKHLEDYNILYDEEFYSFISVSNYFYIHLKKDYFLSQEINLLLHFWSLSVEEQFYIFYSCVYIFLYYKSNLCFNYIQIIDIIFFTISICNFLSFYSINFSISFYTFQCRIWEFIVGIITLSYKINILNNVKTDYIIFVFLYILFLHNTYYYKHIIAIFLSYLIISLGNKGGYILSLNLLKYIGKISYSLYLIHYPIGIFYSNIKIISSCIISIVLYYLVEVNPYIINSTSTLLLVIYVVFFIINYYIYKIIGFVKRMNNMNNISYKKQSIIDVCSFHYIKMVKHISINILLLGDSHTQQYLRAFYDDRNEIRLYHYFLHSSSILKNNYKIELSLFNNKFKLVVISFSHSYFIGKYKIFEENINILLNYISNISAKFLLIVDNPRLFFNPYSFLNMKHSYGIENINCSIVRNHLLLSNYSNNIEVYLYNINKYITKNNMCILNYNNIPVYIDCNHLNPKYVEYFIRKDLQKFIESNIFHIKIWKSNQMQKKLHYFTFIQSGNIYHTSCINLNYTIQTI